MSQHKVKVSYIFVGVDQRYHMTDGKHFKILVDLEDNIPSAYMLRKTEDKVLQDIHQEITHYHWEWVKKRLAGFRKIEGSREVEVTYIATVPYMADTAKKASWKTVEQLQKEGLISDYHGEIIGRTGSYTFN